jgi:hypothetical protein
MPVGFCNVDASGAFVSFGAFDPIHVSASREMAMGKFDNHPAIIQSSDHPSIPDPSSFSQCRCFLLAMSGAHYFRRLCLPFSSSFASASNNGSSIISSCPKKACRSERQKPTQNDEYPYSPDNCMMFSPIELYNILLPLDASERAALVDPFSEKNGCTTRVWIQVDVFIASCTNC